MLYHSEEAPMLLLNGRMCSMFFIIWCLNASKDEVINRLIENNVFLSTIQKKLYVQRTAVSNRTIERLSVNKDLFLYGSLHKTKGQFY